MDPGSIHILVAFHSRRGHVEQLAGAMVEQLADLFDEDVRRVTRKNANLLAPPPNTQGPQGSSRRTSTFKEVRRATA